MVGTSIESNGKGIVIVREYSDKENNIKNSVIVIRAASTRKCMPLLVLALATSTKTTTTTAARINGGRRFNTAPPAYATFLTSKSSRSKSSSIGDVVVGKIIDTSHRTALRDASTRRGALPQSLRSFASSSSSFASSQLRLPLRNTRSFAMTMTTDDDIAMMNDERAEKDNRTTNKKMAAKLVSASSTSLDLCGERLRNGYLVSFPTETVYGLGCHALDANAIRKVFDAKERPLSDPLIVHVSCGEDALGMWAASSSPSMSEVDDDEGDDDEGAAAAGRRRRRFRLNVESRALSALTSTFFPGPLTIVARASRHMPALLMANTGYVACRSPSHDVARELIRRARVPIAAPSANKFGHVSPTSPHHVMDDLGMEDVWIIDPDMMDDDDDDGDVFDDDRRRREEGGMMGGPSPSVVCRVGVESTVVKVEMYPPPHPPSSSEEEEDEEGAVGRITVLRHGAVSLRSVQTSIYDAGLSGYFDVFESVRFTSEDTNNVAPGQMVRHYSPNVPCFMIGHARQRIATIDGCGVDDVMGEERPVLLLDEDEIFVLSKSVVVDYGGRLAPYRDHALVYRDLSPDGDPIVAASTVFETLRWSETIDGATRVFVPELILNGGDGAVDEAHNRGDVVSRNEVGSLALAVKDKLTRAASAVVVARFQ